MKNPDAALEELIESVRAVYDACTKKGLRRLRELQQHSDRLQALTDRLETIVHASSG